MSYRKYLMTDDVPPSELYKTVKIDTNSDTISRKAAIDALKNDMASLDHIIKGMSANDVRLDAYVSQRNQVNYDIYTINNLSPTQPEQLGTNLAEVGTDTISRQAVKEILDKNQMPYHVYPYVWDAINALPPAQPEPKRGRWIYKTDLMTAPTGYWECSECKEGRLLYEENFCPHCGADMREVTE